MAHQAGTNSGFHAMKRLGVFLLPPGWDASPSHGYPQHFAGTHSYTWVERGTVRVKCLAQEHNNMSPARTRTRTTQSGVEHTNHEVTTPLTMAVRLGFLIKNFSVKLSSLRSFIGIPIQILIFLLAFPHTELGALAFSLCILSV